MSAVSSFHSEDHFLCSICLEVFRDPVSTPCGHTYCRSCLTLHWSSGDSFSCPVCKHVFPSKPEVRINRVIQEMVSQFQHDAQEKSATASSSSSSAASSERKAAAEGPPSSVLCDVCTGTRTKAVKSCLVCLASYCETHLEPHRCRLALRRHQLTEPLQNLEERMCPEHDKPLELFCQIDQTCICMLCSVLEHKNHQFVPLREEARAKKAELGEVEAEIQQTIQRKQAKVEEIREAVRTSRDSADQQKAEGVEALTELLQAAQNGLKKLIEDIEEKHRAREKAADQLLGDLEQEICELKGKSSELQRLSSSEDHLHFLQSFPTLKAAAATPPVQDSADDGFCAPLYVGMATRAVAQLEKTTSSRRKKLSEAELRCLQQHAVDVTLDPETANRWLRLSEDRKQVYDDDVWKELPKNPKRFLHVPIVLGEQSISSGRFYFEVQVRGKRWWNVGVVAESVDREGTFTMNPDDGYWVLALESKEYWAYDSTTINLKLQSPLKRVGVFVDYEEGLVSFYDADTAALIHSFTGSDFTEKLLPMFGPGWSTGSSNPTPLVISSLNEIGEILELPDLFM